MTSEASCPAVGAFRIRSATGSLYLLDLTASTLTRFVAAVEPAVDHLDVGMICLRRDGQALPVQQIIRLEVGQPALFLLQVRTNEPEVPTLRATSRVVEIRRLAEDEEGRKAP